MALLVKALGYHSYKGGKPAGGLTAVKAHLKYLEHGKEHPNRPEGFDRSQDSVTRGEFLDKIAAQPQRGVIAHKLVFSISQDEQQRLGVDLRQAVRNVMDDWGRALGRPLTWIGFEHHDNGHPHVHVVVAGYAGEKQVGVFERDLIRLREFGAREIERQASLERSAPLHDRVPDRDREREQIAKELQRVRVRGPERDLDRGK